jgi:serine/threonine protein kinase
LIFRKYRGAEVAVKKLKTQLTKEQLTEFAREASVMVGLRHPNILSPLPFSLFTPRSLSSPSSFPRLIFLTGEHILLFMGVCLEPQSLCIVTEFMSRGSLYDILQHKNANLPFPLIKSIFHLFFFPLFFPPSFPSPFIAYLYISSLFIIFLIFDTIQECWPIL